MAKSEAAETPLAITDAGPAADLVEPASGTAAAAAAAADRTEPRNIDAVGPPRLTKACSDLHRIMRITKTVSI